MPTWVWKPSTSSTCRDMPVTVAVDSSGTSVHNTGPKEWQGQDRQDPGPPSPDRVLSQHPSPAPAPGFFLAGAKSFGIIRAHSRRRPIARPPCSASSASLFLLFILATVLAGSWKSSARATAWESTLHVTIYPIAADASDTTRRTVADLRPEDFAMIGDWLEEPTPSVRPSPAAATGHQPGPTAQRAATALPCRRQCAIDAELEPANAPLGLAPRRGPPDHAPTCACFCSTTTRHRRRHWGHSLGPREGLDRRDQGLRQPQTNGSATRWSSPTNCCIRWARTDKYAPHTLVPIFPDGYAEPQRVPLHPQTAAEIMAGRIPIADDMARIPDTLAQTRIGPQTAREIGLGNAVRSH